MQCERSLKLTRISALNITGHCTQCSLRNLLKASFATLKVWQAGTKNSWQAFDVFGWWQC
jgi:hypothetical protein